MRKKCVEMPVAQACLCLKPGPERSAVMVMDSLKDCEKWVKMGQLTSIWEGCEKDKQCGKLTVWVVAWWINIKSAAAHWERDRSNSGSNSEAETKPHAEILMSTVVYLQTSKNINTFCKHDRLWQVVRNHEDGTRRMFSCTPGKSF